MAIELKRKQGYYAQITLATLLFVSASIQSIRSNRIVDEQISNRINDSISALVEQNEANVYDWASWDDTVELVKQRYENYFIDNFNEDTSRVIQLAIVINDAKEPVSGKVWSEDTQSFESINAETTKEIYSSFQECGSSFTAIIGSTYLLSSSPISPTESSVSEVDYGCLYFGKRIPDPRLSDIFSSLVNHSSLNIKSVSIQPSSTEKAIDKHQKGVLIVKGSLSGMFGSDIIIEKQIPFLSFYQLLIISLYALLVAKLVREKYRRDS